MTGNPEFWLKLSLITGAVIALTAIRIASLYIPLQGVIFLIVFAFIFGSLVFSRLKRGGWLD